MSVETKNAFAVWITGLPAAGKSTLTRALKDQLAEHGFDVAVLESDALRKVFTPEPQYDEKERATFYRQMAYVGALLVLHGTSVIFDATANRRVYRAMARAAIPKLIEVYVECALEKCVERDPKGIYQKARQGNASTVPGLQTSYEPPERPDVVVSGDSELPEHAAARVYAKLVEKGYVPSGS